MFVLRRYLALQAHEEQAWAEAGEAGAAAAKELPIVRVRTDLRVPPMLATYALPEIAHRSFSAGDDQHSASAGIAN